VNRPLRINELQENARGEAEESAMRFEAGTQNLRDLIPI